MTDPARKSSGRPRIRTLKPESWQDENLGGRVGRDARLLFWVLVSLADDEGRFRALPSLIVGHGYPYDDDALSLLPGWLDELAGAGLIALYTVDGMRYGALPGFTEHQRIDRPSPSDLPAPPEPSARTIADDSANGLRSVVRGSEGIRDQEQEGIGSTPRAAARRRERAQPVDHDALPDDFPDDLIAVVDQAAAILTRVAEHKGAFVVARAAVARAIQSRPAKRHVVAAQDFEAWWLHGAGATRKVNDIVAAYRNWLDRELDIQRPGTASPTAATGPLGDPPRYVVADEHPAVRAAYAQDLRAWSDRCAAEHFPDHDIAATAPLIRSAVSRLTDRNGHGPTPTTDEIVAEATRWVTDSEPTTTTATQAA